MKPLPVELDSLACERDQRELFASLSLRLEPGELLQVAGPNGSGKTSLLRIMAGLLPPSAGDMRYGGESVFRGAGRESWRQQRLYIGHAPAVKGALSAEENLAWLCALSRPVENDRIWHALEQVGLRGFEDIPCHNLSAGQQRRVALARLYLEQHPVWILDEPFTAIDKTGVAALESHILQHAQQGGLVIMTTHHGLEHLPGVRCLDLGQVN
ncbi:heme exporter protein A [Halopseudomonas litoralis]|uniref:Heme exporter protein A n=1 Tax=Halopseudomonas litoralis TaxID=797277 RepID=A0A1H1NGR8_9GAMM|nr:cytochrome c biogenesis heme-transporting ATPase CcmA [Halopseudomonas litoralis]SDR97975.1 heme exporter protein A [Halopseudomonas litoralis]